MALKTWSLRNSIVLLLLATTVCTFLLLGAALLLYRLPSIAESSRENAQHQAGELAHLIEFYLSGIESRLRPAAAYATQKGLNNQLERLDPLVGNDGVIDALYVVNTQGAIEAVGLPAETRNRRTDLLVGDFSSSRLFRNAIEAQRPVWSDKYLSAMSGSFVIGVAIPLGKQVIIGEISPQAILDTTRTVSKRYGNAVLVVDSRGEWIADNAGDNDLRLQNWATHPAVSQALSGERQEKTSSLFGLPQYTGHANSKLLGWLFVAGIPAGLANPDVRSSLLLVGGGFFAALLISLLLAPGWAAQIARPLRHLIARTHQLAGGDFSTSKQPASRIREIFDLSHDLERMAEAIRDRERRLAQSSAELHDSEQELAAIFNASPVAMTVSNIDNDYRIISLNQAWEKQFLRNREDTLGKNGADIGFWENPQDRNLFVTHVEAQGNFDHQEAWMLKSDGNRLLCRLSGRIVELAGQRLLIMAQEDITQQRQTELEIQSLNSELEQRVVNRTEALLRSNNELAATLEHLRLTQSELVRSEKQAALGRLVAGVAHELNTPIGNALMAASTSRDQLREVNRANMAGTLRRSIFDIFLQNADTASDIVIRNLERSATLINSFKRVAVDQTSDQRRQFLLSETIAETLMILQPSLKRTPFHIESAIPDDIILDSYPGALEQVLSNLIHNAVLHAFENREHGTVKLTARLLEDKQVQIDVSDDGCGISAEMQKRIFDPFFTTKLGHGGSGLGLHICHNAVTAILGGSINLNSTPGKGSCFEIILPLTAPNAAISPETGGTAA